MTSATLQRATGVVRYKRSGVDFAMTAGLPGGKTMKMVIVAGTAYMNVGEKYQGKNWIRIVPGGSDPLSKALGPILTQLSTGMDLDAQLAGGKDARITAATRTDLGGIPVTKYTVVSSEKALLAQLDKFASTPELRNALRAQFTGAHTESLMWIDNENLPLRIDSRVLGGRAPGTTTTVTYSDWGRRVSIAVPPASDTVKLAG
jgi:YD repeat-containing protein